MRLSWLRTQFGGAPVSVLALTLLVLGCVFVAVAGPRYSLHSRTRVLQQDLAVLTPVDRAVQVTDDWGVVRQPGHRLRPAHAGRQPAQRIAASDRPLPDRDAAAARSRSVGQLVD